MRYTIFEGMNRFESNSRNARKHLIDGGYDEVIVVETKTGKFVSRAIRYVDAIVVSTEAGREDIEREKEWNAEEA